MTRSDEQHLPGLPRLAVLVTLLAIVAGSCTVLCATRWGAYLTGDSHSYIGAARNVIAGNWVTFEGHEIARDPKPLESFPPGYPLMLAAGGLVGIDPLPFSRWLNLAALTVTTALTGWLLWSRTRWWVAVGIGAGATAMSPTFMLMHGSVFSEAVFTACCAVMLAGLVAASRQIDRRGWRTALLCAAALAAGWSSVVRYAGYFSIMAGIMALMLWPRCVGVRYEYTLARRLLAAGTFVLVAAIAPTASTLFNLWALGRPGGRPLAVHPPGWRQFAQLFNTVGEWVLPQLHKSVPQQFVISCGAVALLTLMLIPPILCLRRYWRATPEGRWADAWSVTLYSFAGGYTLFIVAAFTFMDAGIPFNLRILMPLCFAGSVFVVGTFGRTLAERWASPSGGIAGLGRTGVFVLVLGVLSLLGNVTATVRWAGRLHSGGWGYESPRWRANRLLNAIRTEHQSVAGKPLAGNGGDIVALLAGRHMAYVPKWYARPRAQPYTRVPQRIAQFGRWAMANDARIVYFSALEDRSEFLVTQEQLLDRLHMKLLLDDADGRIYQVLAIRGYEQEDFDGDGRPDSTNLNGAKRPRGTTPARPSL